MKKKKTGRPPLDRKSKTIRTGFTTTEKFWKQVLLEAAHRDMNHSELIRAALVYYLTKEARDLGAVTIKGEKK